MNLIALGGKRLIEKKECVLMNCDCYKEKSVELLNAYKHGEIVFFSLTKTTKGVVDYDFT